MEQNDEGQRSDGAESWKAFGSDTEAGRLLKKLYCGNQKPKISYPKLATKPRGEALVPFIPGGGANRADSRTHALAAKVSERAVKAPSFAGRAGRPEVHPIDFRGVRRKPFSEIEKEISEIKRQMDAYRVSGIKKKPNAEKEKLQQTFQYSQGSILPRELLPGSELLSRELSHANALRNGARKPKGRLEQLEEIYDQVLDEIEQRKSFMGDMIALGKPERAAPIEREIVDRMGELRKIHELIRREKAARAGDDNNAGE